VSARADAVVAMADALRGSGVEHPDRLAAALVAIFRTNARDMSCFVCERAFPWDGEGKIPMCCGEPDCHATRNARDAAEIEARTPRVLPPREKYTRPLKPSRSTGPERRRALAVKLTDEEHAQIRELARAAGMPMDGFVLPAVLALLAPRPA
jgi:hypothetical protein